MSLAIDFTSIPRLETDDFRLPAGDFLPTTPLRTQAEAGQPVPESTRNGDFHPSYRMPDCVSALCAAFRHPLGGMFSPGLVL